MKKFIPNNFEPPKMLETKKFRLRMLSINDVVKDYDAVMSSAEQIKGVFGPNDTWPENLTFEQDLIDLGWHQKEFQKKSSFAYTVMSLDEKQCLGCMYIFPSDNPKFDAVVFSWARTSKLENGLDDELYSAVRNWIKELWPFNKIAYPGREITWDKFLNQEK